MKRFVSILLIIMLIVSAFSFSSISSFAEDGVNEDTTTGETDNVPDENEGTDPEGDPTPNETPDGEGEQAPDGEGEQAPDSDGETIPDSEGEPTPDEATDPIVEFIKGIPYGEEILNVWNTIKGYLDQIVAFINSEDTYKNIFTAILAIVAILFIPILLGILVVVYVAIAAMIVFAGALTGLAELFMGMIPQI